MSRSVSKLQKIVGVIGSAVLVSGAIWSAFDKDSRKDGFKFSASTDTTSSGLLYPSSFYLELKRSDLTSSTLNLPVEINFYDSNGLRKDLCDTSEIVMVSDGNKYISRVKLANLIPQSYFDSSSENIHHIGVRFLHDNPSESRFPLNREIRDHYEKERGP